MSTRASQVGGFLGGIVGVAAAWVLGRLGFRCYVCGAITIEHVGGNPQLLRCLDCAIEAGVHAAAYEDGTLSTWPPGPGRGEWGSGAMVEVDGAEVQFCYAANPAKRYALYWAHDAHGPVAVRGELQSRRIEGEVVIRSRA